MAIPLLNNANSSPTLRELTCHLIGSNSLLIKCGELLIERGHRVRSVITDTPQVAAWAAQRGLASHPVSGGYRRHLTSEPFDYLFSLAHLALIPEDVLALPRRGTINFHDGPLPAYAGLNTPVWGLMRGERKWAITFHSVSAELDRGNLLSQTTIDIEPNETSFTLSAKCFEVAISTFAKLIDDLASGTVCSRIQDSTKFEYFGRHQRPDAACVLNWSRTSQELESLVRALDFGHYPNPVGSPKIFYGQEAFVVTRAKAFETATGEPGEVKSIYDAEIRIATGRGDLLITGLSDLHGKPATVHKVVDSWGLAPGVVLPKLDPSRAERLTELTGSVSQAENFWTGRLAEVVGPDLSSLGLDAAGPSTALRKRVPITVPPAFVARYADRLEAALIAVVGAYLARIGDVEAFDLAYQDENIRHLTIGLESFLCPRLPLRLARGNDVTCDEYVVSVEYEIDEIRRRGPYLRDLVARSPELRDRSELIESALSVVAVDVSGDSIDRDGQNLLRFVIAPPGRRTDSGDLMHLEYPGDPLYRDAVDRISAQVTLLLRGATDEPQAVLRNLPLLLEEERRCLLFDWNATNRDYPRNALTQQLFEAQALRTPERTAVEAGKTSLTYRELDARANAIARALRSRGVGRGQRVGLCVGRDVEMLAALLGILKSGAAYVPLDPSLPQQRLRFMAEDAELSQLVSIAGLVETFAIPRNRTLLLGSPSADITSAQSIPIGSFLDARPEDPAYLIYTSGSSGKPKGVVVPHGAVVNFLNSMAREPGISASDVLAAVTTLSFDISVLELLLPLTVGATVVVAREESMIGQALRNLIEQRRVTILQATPVTWRLLLEAGWNNQPPLKALVGGEPLSKALADALLTRGVELWNLYGPTETTVWSTCARVTDTTGGISIGKPIDNTAVYVLDARGNPCSIGVAGELYIGGAGVTLGYWKRQELTEERFITDPFTPGALFYRTGDLARWRADGTLEHLGRLDSQIKLRGFRIEAGEIETLIARHPAVREVVVIAREDTSGDRRLVAYVVTKGEIDDLTSELRRRLREILPEYMIPAHFVRLNALPRTHNGKIDRRVLPAPEATPVGGNHPYIAPRNSAEKDIAQVWSTVLGIEQLGVNENFFDLGGNSLMLLQVHSQICRSLCPDLPFVLLMQYPTISSLAAYLSGATEQTVVPAAAAERARKHREAMRRQRNFRGRK